MSPSLRGEHGCCFGAVFDLVVAIMPFKHSRLRQAIGRIFCQRTVPLGLIHVLLKSIFDLTKLIADAQACSLINELLNTIKI